MPEMQQDEFFWVDSNEPHAQRRKAVLAKYGNQVRKLYGYDNKTAYQVQIYMPVDPLEYHLSVIGYM